MTVLSEIGSDHLHVIAEEVSRVAEPCNGRENGQQLVRVGSFLGGHVLSIRRISSSASEMDSLKAISGAGELPHQQAAQNKLLATAIVCGSVPAL